MKIISKQQYLINEEIRDKEVRVMDESGEALGIMATKAALELAQSKQQDLVLIAPQAQPPVCKMMDFGKFIYETQKREKEAKKKQRVVVIKEIRISPTIEDHDLDVKVKNAEKFLKDGDKVKVTVRFRGREADYAHFGNQLLARFAEKLSELNLTAKKVAIFGTYSGRVRTSDRAVKKMEKIVAKISPNLKLLSPSLSIKVKGVTGPIAEGELTECREFGKRIAKQITT